MIETTATVEENRQLTPGYNLITLHFDESVTALPGQFAMLRASLMHEPLLRRALAIYRTDGPHRVSFLYQILGRGTSALSLLQPASPVDALIPLGNSWPIAGLTGPYQGSRETGKTGAIPRASGAIVVAGGIGSASLLMLCEGLSRAGVETRVFFGAASRRAAIGCGIEDFKALGNALVVSTDDGTLGERGLVTEPLRRYLTESADTSATIYSCGPWKMMAAVAKIAGAFGLRCLASLEAPMGCGFGVCVGCVVAVNPDASSGHQSEYETYRRVCVDGTIFPADKIRWDVTGMAH
jgi:dihydroorotate dehydrogenase electron transfer subunit